MKTILLFFSLVIPFFLSAQNAAITNFNARLTKLEKEMQKEKWYNPPSEGPAADGYHLFLVGEFLWWRAEEDGLTYTYSTDNPTGMLLKNNIKLEDMHFEWDDGFRVGAGFNIPHDNWDMYFCWTNFDTNPKTHKNADSAKGLFPYWTFPNSIAGSEYFRTAKAEWKLFLNLGDIELGKGYLVGKKLSLHPFIGLRTAWINQEFKLEYENASFLPGQTLNDMVKMKCDYWGLGPRAGIDMQWWLAYGFNIYASGALNLLYGEFRIRQKEQTEFVETMNTTHPLDFHDSFHIARVIADLGIGLGWDSMFADDRLHIGIKIGWEQHVFFDQNQFIRFVSDSSTSVLSNRGDLALEGLIGSLRLDF